MSNICYYILDTETTGLSSDNNEINEISIIRVSDGFQYSECIKVKHPERAAPQALQVQNRTKQDLLKGLPLADVVDGIDLILSEDGKTKAHRCIVAHNAPFDRKFCHAAWKSVGKEFQADLWLCTKQFSQRYVAKHGGQKIALAQNNPKPKYGLTDLLTGFKLPIKLGAHSAVVDTQNTLLLFNHLMNSNTEYVSLITRAPQNVDSSELVSY